jgi:hypothetical protein
VLVAYRDFAVYQAGADLKGVDGVEHSGIARAPVVTSRPPTPWRCAIRR